MYRMGKRTGMEPAKDGTIADGWNKRRGMESAQRDEKTEGRRYGGKHRRWN